MARKPHPSDETKTPKAIEDAPPAELRKARDWLRLFKDVMESLRPTRFLHGAGNWYDENGRVRINWVALRPKVEGIVAVKAIACIKKLLLDVYEPPSAHLQAWLQMKNACDQIERRLGSAQDSSATVRVPLEDRTDVLESVPVLVEMIDGQLDETRDAQSPSRHSHAWQRLTTGTASQTGVHSRGGCTSWQDAKTRLEQLRKQGMPYTSRSKLAEQFQCSPSLIGKAIGSSEELRKWMDASCNPVAPGVEDLGDNIVDNVPQSREPDPADVLTDDDVDLVMGKLIEQAAPNERGRLNALDAAGRRDMARACSDQNRDYESSPLNKAPSTRPAIVRKRA